VSRRTRRGFALAAVPALIGIGTAAFIVIRERRARVSVQAREANIEDLRAVVSASGELKPRRYADVSANVSGRITSLLVSEGDAVTRGQVLAHIDSTRREAGRRRSQEALASAQAELRRTEVEVQAIRDSFERARRLHADDLVSNEALEDASARVAAGEALIQSQRRRVSQYAAALAADRDDLEKAVLVAPMDGVVTDLRKQVGELVIGGESFQPTVILTVADLASMDVEVLVGDTDIRNVVLGQPADVRIGTFSGVKINGRVSAIGSEAVARGGSDPAGSRRRGSRDFRVTITLENAPPGLRPGLDATAEIATARPASELAVPLQAVVMRARSRDHGVTDDETVVAAEYALRRATRFERAGAGRGTS
jgi:HlyD family secretion protein